MEATTQTPTLKESTIVERVARIVSSVRGANPDYTRLAAELEPAIPFDVFGVVLLRHDRQAVRVTVCQRDGSAAWVVHSHQHPLVDSKVERLLRSPMTIVENYPAALDGPPATCGDALSGCHLRLRATFIAPLMVGERVLGSLELGSSVLGAYADENLQRLIGAVTRVLAAAIESAQVGGSAEIQDRQRQALKDVSSALTSKMDLSSILNQIVVGVAQALNVASAIVTFDQSRGKLRLEAQSGLNPAILSELIAKKGASSEKTIIGFTVRRRQPCVSNDIDADDRFPLSCNFTTELGVRSIFSYPLVTGTTVYGALLLCSSEPGGFTPLKADILSLFASQATIAIHNGILIESAHQRSRFQQVIEQLERAYEQNVDEQAMLAQVRIASELTFRTFGVSFSSLLHFISDHLLTHGERDLHAILHPDALANQPERTPDTRTDHYPPSSADVQPPADTQTAHSRPGSEVDEEGGRSRIQRIVKARRPDASSLSSHDEGVVLLTQTAEAALARAEVLSELGRLVSELKPSTNLLKDAWFIINLEGLCFYMNPAAQVFSGMFMRGGETSTESTLEDVFAELLPRIRNLDEVRSYLHDFSQETFHHQDMRCVLAVRAQSIVPPASSSITQNSSPSFDVESLLAGEYSSHSASLDAQFIAPTDHHYQLSRHPLVNQQGIHIANVLQVHDVTEQVRDEQNKSALLSSVSHELRTPLTTIKAAVTGLLQLGAAWDEATQHEILEEIDTETDHLAVLVNALIEMSRIEMGALVLEKEWCDIVEVVHGAFIRLAPLLAGRPIRTAFQPNLPLIYADHVQLERVFCNLLEHTVSQLQQRVPNSSASTEILLSLEIVDQGTAESPFQYLYARVIAHGYEVPAVERESMFQGVFKSLHGINVRGSGLGLAICRGIIEAHQGRISVEAVPGEHDSCCFVFTLPIYPYNTMSATAGNHATPHSVGAQFIAPEGTQFITPIHDPLAATSSSSAVGVRSIAPNITEEQS